MHANCLPIAHMCQTQTLTKILVSKTPILIVESLREFDFMGASKQGR